MTDGDGHGWADPGIYRIDSSGKAHALTTTTGVGGDRDRLFEALVEHGVLATDPRPLRAHIDAAEGAAAPGPNEHQQSYWYCVDCNELAGPGREETLPGGCHDEHETVLHDFYNSGLSEWASCLDYLLGDE